MTISPGSALPAPKNRLNFLELLRAGHGDYVINAEALAYCAAEPPPSRSCAC